MMHLLLSIFLSVVTVAFFKLFERYNVNVLQAIIINYVACIVIGNLMSDTTIITQPFWNEPWFTYTLLLGVLFISVFYCIGLTSQKLGISVSMVAAKLSVVIPVSVAFLFHGETLDIGKVIGIVCSLVAVFLISKKENQQVAKMNKWIWLLPVCVFLGSGMIDSGLKFLQQQFIPPANAGDIVSTIFLVAFLTGCVLFLFQKESFQLKSIPWGLAMGIPNFFCMYFLVKTLELYEATFIFPINNIAIVVCSTIVSMLFFKEQLNRLNWVGFVLAIVSIITISFL